MNRGTYRDASPPNATKARCARMVSQWRRQNATNPAECGGAPTASVPDVKECSVMSATRKPFARGLVSTKITPDLIGTRTHVEMGGFAEAFHSAFEPIAGPLYHAFEWHGRIAKQARGPAGICDPGGGVLVAGEYRRLAGGA